MKNTKEAIFNSKELLIVVDMINGFVKDGPLASKSIMRIVPNQREMIQKFINNPSCGVIFVCDSHDANAIEFKRYPKHCIKNTEESMLIDEFKEFEKDSLLYQKNCTNLVYSIAKDLLLFHNLQKVHVIGCLSEICVFDGATSLRTFFDEHNMDVDIYVYEEMIDTYDAYNHSREEINNDSLKWMELKGIKVVRKENNNENI